MPDPRRARPAHRPAPRRPAAARGRRRGSGRDLVKRPSSPRRQRCRAGEVAPGRRRRRRRRRPARRGATSLRRGGQRHRRAGAHQPRPRAAVAAPPSTPLRTAAGPTDVELDLATGAARPARPRRAGGARRRRCPPPRRSTWSTTAPPRSPWSPACSCRDGGSVVIARGELVEIGDGFRIPELLESVGARLREVGTTNRVRLERLRATPSDDDTAFVLKVHPSNFSVRGFTSAVAASPSSRRSAAPLVVDIGSGPARAAPAAARRARRRERPARPAPTSSPRPATSCSAARRRAAARPEAELVERLRRHPFARALRVDKLTLAALEATLAGPVPPVARGARRRHVDDLRARARADRRRACPSALGAEVVDSDAAVGGGGAPDVVLPSAAVALPERLRRAAARGRPAGRRPPRARPAAARPAAPSTPRRTPTWPRPYAASRGGAADARRRHRRPRRPRQVRRWSRRSPAPTPTGWPRSGGAG